MFLMQDKSERKRLADLVSERRKRMSWKQFALADEAGVSARTIQRLECGSRVSEETIEKVLGALNLSETPPRNGRSRCGEPQSDHYFNVGETASGLHGKPLGFSDFLRLLPTDVLELAAFDLPLQVMITVHAMLIVDNKPNGGVEEARINDESVGVVRKYLIVEHFRRLMLKRARYPRDPFSEAPEILWWENHPLVCLLSAQHDTVRDRCIRVMLGTGDTSVLTGLAIAQTGDELDGFTQRLEEIERDLTGYLADVENRFHDSRALAWSETPTTQPE